MKLKTIIETLYCITGVSFLISAPIFVFIASLGFFFQIFYTDILKYSGFIAVNALVITPLLIKIGDSNLIKQ